MAPNDELAAIQAALRLQPQSSRGEVVTETELAADLADYPTTAEVAAAYVPAGGTLLALDDDGTPYFN